jgi:hypothetical protein
LHFPIPDTQPRDQIYYYSTKARTPATAAATETIPPETRAALPWNMMADGLEEAEGRCRASAPLGRPWLLEGVAMDIIMLEEGVALGICTGIME